MKRITFTIITAVALGAAVSPTWAQTCDTTFTAASGKVWQDDDHWDNEAPDADKVGCIPSDKFVIISTGICNDGPDKGKDCPRACPDGVCDYSIPDDVAAKAVVVDGELELNQDTSLTLSGNSSVDGRIVLVCADLFIDDDLTISRDGGEIRQKFTAGCNSYLKSASGTDYLLTIQPSDTGNNLHPENSLVLTHQLVIDVDLHNDAYVLARKKTLTLQGGEKTGGGYWMAEKEAGHAAGTLDVDVAVTGGGTWKITTSEATIRMDATCTSLTGDFALSAGTLEINRNLMTTGDLDFSGTAIIKVAELKAVNFN